MRHNQRAQKSTFVIFIILFTLTISQFVFAQEDDKGPQEPPYTQEESEFGGPDRPTVDLESEVTDSQAEKHGNDELPIDNSKIETANKETIESTVQIENPVYNPKKGTKYIEHPLAEKGLIRIEKDGSYIYKTDIDQAGHNNKTGVFRIGGIDAPKILAKDGLTTFETMYQGSPVPYFMFDYEWQPFTSFGRLGIQLGIGFLISHGNGRFACDTGCTVNGQIAKESYTFLAVPLTAGGLYRLDLTAHQWVAPYLAGGGAYIPVFEIRDDNSSPHGLGVPGVYGAGGVMFNITALDKDTAFVLKKEYGISNLWVTGEYRILKNFNADLDFSSNIISAGISVDYF